MSNPDVTSIFINLVARLGLFALTLLVIRLTAIAMFFVLDQDFNEVSMAVLTKTRYFYLGYCIGEATVLSILLGATIKFYLYHKWLKENDLTTYLHILKLRESPSSISKVQPKIKMSQGKGGVIKKESPTAAKSRGIIILKREN